jgi:hypothetical protein
MNLLFNSLRSSELNQDALLQELKVPQEKTYSLPTFLTGKKT